MIPSRRRQPARASRRIVRLRQLACLLVAGLLAWFGFSSDLRAQAEPQYRAFWVDTFNTRLQSPQDTASIVARARAAHVNTLLVQVRRRGDAWYVDPAEPLPEGASIEPDFDPLGDLITHAHAAGIDVHAFVMVGAIWNQATLPLDPRHVFNRHGLTPAGTPQPGRANWLTRTLVPDGGAISYGGHRFGGEFWLDFGHPDAATYTVDLLRRLVDAYDLDGLHLDGLRYPDVASGELATPGGANVGYNDVSLERFRRRYGLGPDALPPPDDPRWSAWRREQITALLRRIHLTVSAVRPNLVLSVAATTSGDAPASDEEWMGSDAYARVFQDWPAWVREGIVDVLVPTPFRPAHVPAGAESFARWVAWARAKGHGRHVVVGIGAYLNAVEGTLRQARRALEPDPAGPTHGVAFFSLGAHNAPVTSNPFAVPGPRDTPYRAFEDLAAGLTTGRAASGGALEAGGVPPLFATTVPPPVMPWKAALDRGHLAGTIDGPDGIADGAEVLLETIDGTFALPGRVDGSGFFGGTWIAPGRYHVVVVPPGGGRYRSSCDVEVTAGAVASLRLQLDPSGPAVAACTAEILPTLR
ncbi:MAG TPA: family 10 glycosylhydrolase [Vicinamibacterales bacterium]